MTATQVLDQEFRTHRGAVFGVAYRMLGTVPDADEVVQDTFVRALERAPDLDRSLRPWLMRVAVNLSRDRLRRRRRRGYVGPWLPGPLDLDDPRLVSDRAHSPEARIGRMESLAFAFLVALEALTPNRRAVLLLRDVFDCSVAETAEMLSMSASNVKTTLHRARRTLAAAGPIDPPSPERQVAALTALQAFGEAVQRGDPEAVAALLTDDVVLVSDGGGRYHAALKPVVGADRVARLYLGLLKTTTPQLSYGIRMLNGMPAVVAYDPGVGGRLAKRWVIRVETDAAGRIRRIHSVLADDKVAGVAPLTG